MIDSDIKQLSGDKITEYIVPQCDQTRNIGAPPALKVQS